MAGAFFSGVFFSAGIIFKSNDSLDIRFNGTEIINDKFLRGNITKKYLKVVNLLDGVYFENRSRLPLTACNDVNSQVFLWRGPLNNSLQSIHGTNDSHKDFNTTIESFVPHIFAVKNALLNRDGGIFDAQFFFHRGGCADEAWHTWPFIYDFNLTKVKVYNEPVLTLGQPYEGDNGFMSEIINSNLFFQAKKTDT